MLNTIESMTEPTSVEPDHEQRSVLTGVDELFAALNTELSCLNLITFNQPDATLGRAAIALCDWQKGSTIGSTTIPISKIRRNGNRLERFGLIERMPVSYARDGDLYKPTMRGIVGSSLAGHLLDLAYRQNIALSDLFGVKVRRISVDIDDESQSFSPPLFRTLLLIATKKQGDINGEVRSQDYHLLRGISEVELVDELKVGHVVDLAKRKFLETRMRTQMISGMPIKSRFFSINPKYSELVNDLEEIVKGVSSINQNWEPFIKAGFDKALKIANDPESVAMLLKRAEIRSQAAYEIPSEDFLDAVRILGSEGGFTTGQVRKCLGGVHNVQYISNYLRRLEEDGIITCIERTQNRKKFKLADTEAL